MIEYYTLLFILFAFIQDEVKGVFSSLICFLMIYINEPFFEFMSVRGFNFFETMIFYDLLFFCVGLFIIGSRVGNTLLTVVSISALLNIIGYFIVQGDFYNHFKDSYKFINVLMFEVLLYMSFTSTIVYPWLVEKFKKVKV